MCCYYNLQWLHKNCRKKLILKNWNPIKRLKQECTMTCLHNIFWTIYKGLFTKWRENVSSKEFFFLNIEHSISYIIFRKIILTVINELIREQFVWKKSSSMFLLLGNSYQNFFTRIQNTNDQYLKIVDGFSFILKCTKENKPAWEHLHHFI